MRPPAERPRSAGVLAQPAETRQPQTTKHLQTLERAGVVTSQRTGRRRIHALRSAALRDLAAELSRLADTADAPAALRRALDVPDPAREVYELGGRLGIPRSLAELGLAAGDVERAVLHAAYTGEPPAGG